MSNPIVLSGPSGVGKGYLGRHLSTRYMCERLIATTTRLIRPSEVDRVDSHFVTEEEFLALMQVDGMFMCNRFFDAWYGFEYANYQSIIERGVPPIVEIYTPTIADFLQQFAEAQTIFLLPVSLELLRQRMVERKQDEESIKYRLQRVEEEMRYFREEGHAHYQSTYVIADDNFDAVVADIVARCSLQSR